MAIEVAEPTTGQVSSRSYRAQGELPLVVHADGNPSVPRLVEWLIDQTDHVRELLTRHGAILFRGFDVVDATDFERIARAIDDDLQSEYMGISPRNALTDYVFTASEIPSLFPIPQHNEMSFVANPPRSLFFWCDTEPAAETGETPLVDMRRVHADLDPEVRERFEKRGIRIVRNYRAPGKERPWDLTQLKSWVDMFQTTDHAIVEEKCAREGFTPVWGADNSLKLISTQAAVKAHPRSGEMVWFNHAAVFHTSNGDGELRRIFQLRPSVRSLLGWMAGKAYTVAQRRLRKAEDLPMHCTYADGSIIPDSDMEAVRDAIWKNLVITPWQNRDVLAIDNDSTGHGRMPFYGPRMVAVAWA